MPPPAYYFVFFFLISTIPIPANAMTMMPATTGIVGLMSPVFGVLVPGVTVGESYIITCWISFVSSTLKFTFSATS